MENEELDPLYAAVFENPENGTPDNISQAGCLALARLGKEAWNAWRLKYPVSGDYHPKNIAIFSELVLDGAECNFSGFKFGDRATFESVRFLDQASFFNAEFGICIKFNNAIFHNTANFEYAFFGNSASFKKAEFRNDASFEYVQFGDNAQFMDAKFNYHLNFIGARFGDTVNFNGVECKDEANFSGVQFRYDVRFIKTQFDKKVDFSGAQFGKWTKFQGAIFNNEAIFVATNWSEALNFVYFDNQELCDEAKKWAEDKELNPELFYEIDFSGATFNVKVDFSGRTFTRKTSFGMLFESYDGELPKKRPVTFEKAPLFHNCKLYQDTTFDGAEFPKPSSDPTENDIAARAYRTLKLAFSQHQAIREEQKFFRLEMVEEAARATRRLNKWMFWLYSYFSDYGFSLYRPICLLLATFFIFILIYSCLADLTFCWWWAEDCQIKSELWQFTLIQTLPLPGFDKWSESLREGLFPKGDWQSVLLTVFVMLHKAIAFLAVFLFGLALRNLFKMK